MRHRGSPVDLTICPLCGRHASDVAARRLNTAYCDDLQNIQTSCGECYSLSVEYYHDLWIEYYNGRL